MKMKVVLVVLGLFLLVGCSSSRGGTPIYEESDIEYIHDSKHNVGCWIHYYGLSCIPDSQYMGGGDD